MKGGRVLATNCGRPGRWAGVAGGVMGGLKGGWEWRTEVSTPKGILVSLGGPRLLMRLLVRCWPGPLVKVVRRVLGWSAAVTFTLPPSSCTMPWMMSSMSGSGSDLRRSAGEREDEATVRKVEREGGGKPRYSSLPTITWFMEAAVPSRSGDTVRGRRRLGPNSCRDHGSSSCRVLVLGPTSCRDQASSSCRVLLEGTEPCR